jgi:hypothetical protein
VANVAEILVQALFEDKGASHGVKGLSQDVEHLGGASNAASSAAQAMSADLMGMVTKLAAYAGGAISAAKAVEFLTEAVKDYAKAEQISAKLEAVLTATDHAAGLTKHTLDELAKSLSGVTGVSKSVISDAEAVLLTFRNIRGEAFERTTKAALDLSAVMGSDLQSAVLQLGKAIQDAAAGETTGLTALRRAGVSFTESQTEMIKKLGESGQSAEAVALVLTEVERQVGGVAERMGSTAVGEVNKLTNAFHGLKKVIGGMIVESAGTDSLSDLTTVIKGLTHAIEEGKESQERFPGWLQRIGEAAASTLGPLGSYVQIVNSLAALSGTFGRVGDSNVPKWAQATVVTPKGVDETLAQLGRINADEESLEESRKKREALRKKAADEAAKAAAKALKELEDQITKENEAYQKLSASVVGLSQASGASVMDLSKLLAVVDSLDPAFANAMRAASDLAEEGLAPIGDLLSRAVKGITDIEPLASGIVTYTKKWVDSTAFDQVTDSLRENVAWALGGAITTALTGGDVEEAAAGFARILTSTTSSALSSALSVIMKGGSLAEAGAAAGVWDPEANEGKGGVSWGGVGQMVGGLISYKGQQSGNRGQAALGGAISGASAGSAGGIGWGTLIGAVVGAAMGYMSAGKSNTPYHLQWGYKTPISTGPYTGTWTGSSADVTGMGDMEERGIARKMTDTYRSNVLGFRDLLYAMRQPVTGTDLTGLGFDLSGKTGDFNALLTEVLTSTIPRQVLEKYTPAITTGLGGMGVSEGRVATEMAKFSPMEGDIGPAMEVFKEWVTTILQLQDAEEAMLTSLPAILENLDKSQIDTWREGFADTLDQVGRLSAELGQLTTEEQIARAKEGAEAIAAEVERSTQLIANLQAMREDFEASVVALQEGQRFNAAQRGGADDLQGFLDRRFMQALRDINEGMLDPEQLQVAQEDAVKYGQALLDLADQMEASVSLYRQLGDSMAALDGQLSATLEDRLAALAADSQTAFSTAAGTALEKLASLREGLDGLTSQDKLTRLTQIRDLTTNTLQLTEDNLASLYRAGLSVTRIFDDLSESFDLAEAEKAGPQAKGEYLVAKLFKLQNQLGGAKSPEELQAILESIASYAQQLYAMDETINLKDPASGKVMDVLTWLRPWLDQQEAQAAAKVEAWKAQNQAVMDSLREGLAGLATVAGDEATKLEASIAAIRKLVDEGLAGAVRDSGTQIEAWQTEIAAGMGALKDAMGDFTDALTGPDVGLITALNTVKKEGDELGDSFDRLRNKIEKLIAVIDKGIGDDEPNPANGMGTGDLGSDPLSSARAWAVRSSGAYDSRMA